MLQSGTVHWHCLAAESESESGTGALAGHESESESAVTRSVAPGPAAAAGGNITAASHAPGDRRCNTVTVPLQSSSGQGPRTSEKWY